MDKQPPRLPYLRLWLLLTGALVILVLFALADDEIMIGGKTLKKAPFAETLFRKSENENQKSNEDSIFLTKEDLIIETDTTSQTFFIFGDSMTMHLAQRLASYAAQNGHKIYAVNWDSSNTKTWAESDTLDFFIRKYNPTQIFIVLGANELYLKTPEIRLPQIKKIIEKIGDIPYVWIGPPALKMDGGLNEVLEANLAPKSFFRSSGLQMDRKSDKIHPTKSAASYWMDSVMRWIPQSRHPFLAEFPADSLSKISPNLIFLKAKNK